MKHESVSTGERICKIVRVTIHELIQNDFEGVMDLFAERAGDPNMTEIAYTPVGQVYRSDILFEVSGCSSELCDYLNDVENQI